MTIPLHILLAEDSTDDAQLIMLQLEQAGLEAEYLRVDNKADFTAALTATIDLILSDYKMPRFNGLQALSILKASGLDIPFILISGTVGEETAVEAIKQGADDYVMKDRPQRLVFATQRALEQKRLRVIASKAETNAIYLVEELEKKNVQLIQSRAKTEETLLQLLSAYDETIQGWSHALDLRDKETKGHSLRVTEAAVELSRNARIVNAELVHIRHGALLHDIGKLGIPDAILHKPDKLTDEEWVIMRKHPTFAYELLSPIKYLRLAIDIPYCHHEKWDGTGYPRGLKGEQIPFSARLFAIVDVWDALRTERPYRKAWEPDKVIEHIKSLSGTHFDPRAVELFLDMLNRLPDEH